MLVEQLQQDLTGDSNNLVDIKGEGNLPFFLFKNTVYLYSMKELINYFLKQPIDNAYIERVAFQYFNSDFKSAELFLSSLREENNQFNRKNSSIHF